MSIYAAGQVISVKISKDLIFKVFRPGIELALRRSGNSLGVHVMKKFSLSALALGFIGLSAPLFASSLDKVYCPADYQPTLCTYDSFSAEGGNRCWALVSLESQLKASGVDYDVNAIHCVRSDVQLLKTSKPDCGIVPTTTTCSTIVNGVTWTETATSCDSPLPTLEARLTKANIDLGQVTITCEREQYGRAE